MEEKIERQAEKDGNGDEEFKIILGKKIMSCRYGKSKLER